MILSEKIIMVEPRGFSFNPETGVDNSFQSGGNIQAPSESAMREFHDLKNKLVKADITVKSFSWSDGAKTPDAVFPNNWFSTTPDGKLILYPMMAVNRRNERRKELIDSLKKNYSTVIDLTHFEAKEIYLEGTGSLVIDHEHKVAYASLSGRTCKEALKEWEDQMKYEVVTFESNDRDKKIIYHTNVMLSLCNGYAIVCLESVTNEKERESLRKKLSQHFEIIEISLEQMHSYCGNCLELKNMSGNNFLVMSAQAYNGFTEKQKHQLIKHTTIIYSALNTIETLGGGSARCMMAELF